MSTTLRFARTSVLPDGPDPRAIQPHEFLEDVILNGGASKGDQLYYDPAEGPHIGVRSAPIMDVRDFGAYGDGTHDDRAAIQAAIDAAPAGSTVLLPPASYLVKKNGSADHLFFINKGLHVVGSRWGSAILCDDDVDVGVFLVAPATLDIYPVEFNGLRVFKNTTPSYIGDVIRVNVQAGKGLHGLTIRDCDLFSYTGYAVAIYNGYDEHNAYTALNQNGVYETAIENSTLYGVAGSVKMLKLGDTNRVANCELSGGGIGLEVSMLNRSDPASAASTLEIRHNIITSTGGSIKLTDVRISDIVNNNIESQLTDEDAMIAFYGPNMTLDIARNRIMGNKIQNWASSTGAKAHILVNGGSAFTIEDNHCGVNGGTPTVVKLVNARAVSVGGNVIKSSIGNVDWVNIDSDCQDVMVGDVYTLGTTAVVKNFGQGTVFTNPFEPRYPTFSADTLSASTVTVENLPAHSVSRTGIETLSANLVLDGSFTTGEGWIVPDTGWAITGGQAVATSTDASHNLSQPIGVKANQQYEVTYTVVVTDGEVAVSLPNSVGGAETGTWRSASGTYTERLTANSNVSPAGSVYFITPGGFTGTLDDVSVKEVYPAPLEHGFYLYKGTGSPEGVVAATVGSLYLASGGGASTTLYVKETGSGNTGWAAK